MRHFTDLRDRGWTAQVGRESYGMQVLLFFPDGGGEVLKTMLAATTRLDGERELAAMDDDALREALARAQPWSGESLLPGQ